MSLTDNHNRAFGMEVGRIRFSIFGARPCVKHWCYVNEAVFLVKLVVNWDHETACTRPKYCCIKEWFRIVEITTQDLPTKYQKVEVWHLCKPSTATLIFHLE